MKRLFENLFYRTYLIALINKYNTHHLDSAIMLFCIFQMLNIGGLMAWSKYLEFYITPFGEYPMFIIGLIWSVLNFLYFYARFESIK